MPNTIPEKTGPAALIDHTLLAPTTTQSQIDQLCEEAVEYGFAAVCVPPLYVKCAASHLYGSDISVATVCGFPWGYSTSESKQREALQAVEQGAAEIDMVIAVGAVVSGDWAYVEQDIAAVVQAVPEAAVKVILECCLLHDEQIDKAVFASLNAGAAFVKTSTGFSSGGARVEDVARMARLAAGRMQVKASGGIRDLPTATRMIEAGATRLGTSSGVQIQQQWLQAQHP